MVRGAKDWASDAQVAQVASLQDLGELAVRLGSPVDYDRGGNVVLMENFDGGVQPWIDYFINTWGAGAGLTHSRDYPMHGLSTAKAVCGTTDDKCVELGMQLPYPQSSKLGAAITFFPDSNLQDVELYLNIYTGAEYFTAGIKVEAYLKKVYRLNVAPGWVEVGDDSIYQLYGAAYHSIKLVMDTANDRYLRVTINNSAIDLTASPLRSGISSAASKMLVLARFVDTDGTSSVTYVDNIICTQNEL